MEENTAEADVVKVEKFTLADILKFLIPSLIGIGLFLVPISYNGSQTILVGIITKSIISIFSPIAHEIVLCVFLISFLGSLYYCVFKPDWERSRPLLHLIFPVTPFWFVLRLLAALLSLMVYFQLGPDVLIGKDTGTLVMVDIAIPVVFIVFIACYFMPFLTDFGFMELVGSMVRAPFELLFKLPGRAAVDATASFLSANSVGLLITLGQYNKGQYTAREAASIATNFSVVSISFSLVVAEVAGLSHIFFPWYLSVIAACVVCALITVRIPPLSRVSNTYLEQAGKHIHEEKPDSFSSLRWGLHEAVRKAKKAPSFKQLLKESSYSAFNIIMGIHGPTLVIATLSAILVFHTPFYTYLSAPLVPILEFFNLPEATAAAPAFIAGFLDMFMPAIIAGNIESEFTRFVLAGLSLTQLIYVGEIVFMIIRSNLPLSIGNLIALFVLRTLISTPILMMAATLLL